MLIVINVQLASLQCIALLAANNLLSGLSSVSSVASSIRGCGMIGRSSLYTAKKCEDSGRPAHLFQSVCMLVSKC